MNIDLVLLVVVGLFGGMGLWSGAIRQLANLGGLVAGYLSARPLGMLLGPVVAQKLGYPLLLTSIGCSFLLFFAVYVLTVSVLRFVLAKILPDGEHGGLNRFGGLLIGAAKAVAICFVVLSALVLVEKPLTRLWREYGREAKGSVAIAFAKRHSLFAKIPQLSSLERIVKASGDPEAAARLADDPQIKALSKDPRVKSMADDASVRRALASGDYAALLSSVKVLSVLNDPRLSEKLARAASGSAEAPAPSGEEAKPEAKPRATPPR